MAASCDRWRGVDRRRGSVASAGRRGRARRRGAIVRPLFESHGARRLTTARRPRRRCWRSVHGAVDAVGPRSARPPASDTDATERRTRVSVPAAPAECLPPRASETKGARHGRGLTAWPPGHPGPHRTARPNDAVEVVATRTERHVVRVGAAARQPACGDMRFGGGSATAACYSPEIHTWRSGRSDSYRKESAAPVPFGEPCSCSTFPSGSRICTVDTEVRNSAWCTTYSHRRSVRFRRSQRNSPAMRPSCIGQGRRDTVGAGALCVGRTTSHQAIRR